jgi:hypothetical protein
MFRRAALACVLLGLAACWSGYEGRARVHAEVLTWMADKLIALVEANKPPAVEGMGEYVYPAKRAREFLGSYSGYAEYESHRALTELVVRYEVLVQRVDAARAGAGDWSASIDWLRREKDELHRIAAAINQSLDAGR